MRRLLVTAALAALAAVAAPAAAREPGFELHGELGPAYVRSQASRNGFTQSVGGLGPAHALGLGWSWAPGWLVGAEYWGTLVYGPRLRTRGPGEGDGLTYRIHAFGPTVRAPLPADLFVALTPSVTRIALSDNDPNGFTWKWGFGLKLAAGRDWWLGDRVSLGVAAVAQAGLNAQDEPSTPRWNTLGGGVVMTLGLR